MAQTFVEIGDAADVPALAQSVTGVSPLTAITGTLSQSDLVDMFRFQVTGGTFTAEVTAGGDTQLFLFNSAGLGVFANDDKQTGPNPLQSLITGALAPGEYLLAISPWDFDPASSGGLIFPNFSGGGQFGPTGPGGAFPVSAWTGTTFSTGFNYTIALTNAASLPGGGGPGVPDGGSSLALMSIALLAVVSARSRLK
jgi:hypothetical protein